MLVENNVIILLIIIIICLIGYILSNQSKNKIIVIKRSTVYEVKYIPINKYRYIEDPIDRCRLYRLDSDGMAREVDDFLVEKSNGSVLRWFFIF